MSGKRWVSPAQMRVSIGTGITTVGEPVPGVEVVDAYEYHPPTKEEDDNGY